MKLTSDHIGRLVTLPNLPYPKFYFEIESINNGRAYGISFYEDGIIIQGDGWFVDNHWMFYEPTTTSFILED